MSKLIDHVKVIELLDKAVALKGADYIYEPHDDSSSSPSCFYARQGKPDCIVGHVLADLGVPVKELEYNADEDLRGKVSSHSITSHWCVLEEEFGLEFTADARTLLYLAQGDQDNLFSWGTAVENAKDAIS